MNSTPEGQQHAHMIAAAYAQAVQTLGPLQHAARQLVIRDPLAGEDHGELAGLPVPAGEQHVAERGGGYAHLGEVFDAPIHGKMYPAASGR